MREACDLCGDAGTLRDGSLCPKCSVSRWQELGQATVVARPKRTVWVRVSGEDTLQRVLGRSTASPLRSRPPAKQAS